MTFQIPKPKTGTVCCAVLCALVLSLASCSTEDAPTPEPGIPITLTTITQEEAETRAVLEATHKSFKVFANAIYPSGNTVMMDGYRVNHISQTGWTYTQGDGTSSQTDKYWIPTVQSIRFHAGAPQEKVKTIGIDGLRLSIATTKLLSDVPLYSSALDIASNDSRFGQNVSLSFNYAMCCVVFEFRFKGSQSQSHILKDVAIQPSSSSDRIPKSSDFTITYDWDTATMQTALENTTYMDSGSKITLGDVTLNADGSTYSKPQGTNCLLMIPCSIAWKITANLDGQPIQGIISQEKADFRAGYKNRLRFNISDYIHLSELTLEPWVDETLDIEVGG